MVGFSGFVQYESLDVSISAARLSALWRCRLSGPVSRLLKMEVALDESVMLNPFKES